MDLNKKSLDLSYKLLANARVKDYENHISDFRNVLLSCLVEVYIKARDDERKSKDYDPATQSFVKESSV